MSRPGPTKMSPQPRLLRNRLALPEEWHASSLSFVSKGISVNLEQIGVILTELLLRLRDSARDLGPLPHGIVSHKLEDASCRGL
jgi:hypothetical protein